MLVPLLLRDPVDSSRYPCTLYRVIMAFAVAYGVLANLDIVSRIVA